MRYKKKFFELHGIKVTEDPIIEIQDKVLSDKIEYWHSKVINPKNDKLYAVQELPKLIEQYPEAKAFKNYLYGMLMALGREKEALVVLQDTIKKHPDYVFAKINYAETLLFDNNPNKAASLLIEPYDVRNIEKGEFIHYTVFWSYYTTAFKIEVARKNLKKVEEIHHFMFDYDKKDPLVEEYAIKIILMRMEQNPLFNKSDNLKEVLVFPKPIQKSFLSDNEGQPVFNHFEIKDLYKYSEKDIPRDVIQKILMLPRTTLIQDLEHVFLDMVLRWDYFTETDFEEQTHSFGTHALYLLTELKAYESLPSILNIFRQDADITEYWFSDSIEDCFSSPLYILGESQLDVFKAFVLEKNILSWHRGRITEVVAQVALNQPERRSEVIEWFRDIMNTFLKNPDDDDLIDSIFLGSMMWDLTKFSAIELESEITSIFETLPVDVSISGNLKDILKQINLPFDEFVIDPLPNDIFELYSGEYRKRRAESNREMEDLDELPNPTPHAAYLKELHTKMLLNAFKGMHKKEYQDEDDFDYEEENDYDYTPQLPIKREEPKVGRNDPCPCGSGKKYKKCHGK
jgi:SEC-C motif/Protein of unknown function (DUF1186)